MVTQISWSTYITTVTFLVIAYYLVIILRYYSKDIFKLLAGKNSGPAVRLHFTQSENKEQQKPHEAYMQKSVEEQNLFKLLQSLSDEVQAFLNEAANSQFDKNDIIKSMKQIIAKYKVLKDSRLFDAVQKFIQSSCEADCSVLLSEEELGGLWN